MTGHARPGTMTAIRQAAEHHAVPAVFTGTQVRSGAPELRGLYRDPGGDPDRQQPGNKADRGPRPSSRPAGQSGMPPNARTRDKKPVKPRLTRPRSFRDDTEEVTGSNPVRPPGVLYYGHISAIHSAAASVSG
jgi:hypothetical protein